jgi:membrane-bound lytic murein transglycosylase MltF
MMRITWRHQHKASLSQNSHRNLRWVVSSLVLLALIPTLAVAKSPVLPQPTTEVKREIAKLLKHTLPQFDIDPQRLPGRFRRQVIRGIYEYTVLYRADVQAKLQRAMPYLQMMKRTLRQYELPTYFAYIPLVESAFRVDATHPRSGARGLWQLMPATARGFGLQVSPQVDERLDPRLATQAAARYLRKLRERFGAKAPMHILAAYNHGDTNLARVMRRTRTQDIWHLYTYRRLPYETRAYLIKMVTWWVIVTHAEQFQLLPDNVSSGHMFTDNVRPRPLSFAAAGHTTATIQPVSTQ